jgi:hypothetical protein
LAGSKPVSNRQFATTNGWYLVKCEVSLILCNEVQLRLSTGAIKSV